MEAEPKRPFAVVLCMAIIKAAGAIVPAARRGDWKQEWLAEVWHRWQFLYHAGAWNYVEGVRLIRNCLGAFADAGWHFAAQDAVQNRIREAIRSPWTCLTGWTCGILTVVLLSSGLPATRNLVHLSTNRSSGRLLFVWLHPSAGGGDKGLPSDVTPAWASHSHLLEGAAQFTITRENVEIRASETKRLLVVKTDAELFRVLQPVLAVGSVPSARSAVLTYGVWKTMFHADNRIVGSVLHVGPESYRISGVLDRSFEFLSRQPALYVIGPPSSAALAMVVVRARPGVSQSRLDRELTRIAQISCYYFFQSELRYAFLNDAAWVPVQTFAISVFVSALVLIAVSRLRIRRLRTALLHPNRKAVIRRAGFWIAKTSLALSFVFLAGLEWSRSESAVLFGSQDPASGPFLLWLYILGSMAVLFWSLADQRARCRVCLRLLCFPVRIGCPGCLLLDWSGTELLCTEGHGVLHVPHMAPSWDEESDRWIALDDSWKELFVNN